MKKFLIYLVSIPLSCFLFVEVGSELITQYTMYLNDFSQNERHLLADDLGFGILLMMGLVPELILGCVTGFWLDKKVSDKFRGT
jgi:hypothetical protein